MKPPEILSRMVRRRASRGYWIVFTLYRLSDRSYAVHCWIARTGCTPALRPCNWLFDDLPAALDYMELARVELDVYRSCGFICAPSWERLEVDPIAARFSCSSSIGKHQTMRAGRPMPSRIRDRVAISPGLGHFVPTRCVGCPGSATGIASSEIESPRAFTTRHIESISRTDCSRSAPRSIRPASSVRGFDADPTR